MQGGGLALAPQELGQESTVEEGIDAFAVERFVRSDPDYQFARIRLEERLRALRSIEFQEKQYVIPGRYGRLQEEVEQYEADMNAAAEAARVRAIGMLSDFAVRKKVLSSRARVKSLESELIALNAKRDAFEREFQAENRKIEQMGGETADLNFARQDLAQSMHIFSKLNERAAILTTEQRRDYSVYTLSEAKPPRFPSQTLPYKHMAIFGLAGLLIPFGLAFVFEFQHKRLVDPKALEDQLLLPVLGEIARMPTRRNGHQRQMYEESVESLRANLAFKLQSAQTLLVTSAMPSEGKSSLAAKLAMSMARSSGETVLLIDADIRDPDQHELLDLDLKPGMCPVLCGEATLKEAINTSLGPSLHVLTAGLLDESPHAALSRRNCAGLIAECRKHYSHIVIDSAPVLSAAETLNLAAECDATLLCAMRDVSRSDNTTRAARRLAAAGSNVVGTVFSGVPSNVYAYRYGKYQQEQVAIQS